MRCTDLKPSPPRGVPSARPRSSGEALCLLAFVFLAGCADSTFASRLLDDGPPAAVGVGDKEPLRALTGERPIRRADSTVVGFPNLASVPPRPTRVSTPPERQAAFERLQGDRNEAGSTATAVVALPTDGSIAQPTTSLPQIPDAPPPTPRPLKR